MSLRPIDLQVVLKQSVNVAKTEKKKIDKKEQDKEQAKSNSISRRARHSEGISDVDKVEVDANVIHEQPRKDKRGQSGSKKKDDEDKKNVKSPLDDKYKGNFLDITE